jgi:hypothetical protein
LDCSFDPTMFCEASMNKIAIPLLKLFFGPTSDAIDQIVRYGKYAVLMNGLLSLLLSIYLATAIVNILAKKLRQRLKR